MFKLYWREDRSHEWIHEGTFNLMTTMLSHITATPVLKGQYKAEFNNEYTFFTLDVSLKGGI